MLWGLVKAISLNLIEATPSFLFSIEVEMVFFFQNTIWYGSEKTVTNIYSESFDGA